MSQIATLAQKPLLNTPLRSEMRVEDIGGLPLFKSGTATVAPTHKPINFWESIVLKDDGTNRRLWIYINGTWRQATLS